MNETPEVEMHKVMEAEMLAMVKSGKVNEGLVDASVLMPVREWLEEALMENGAKVEGGGIGFGQADVEISLDNHKFIVSIKPLDE